MAYIVTAVVALLLLFGALCAVAVVAAGWGRREGRKDVLRDFYQGKGDAA